LLDNIVSHSLAGKNHCDATGLSVPSHGKPNDSYHDDDRDSSSEHYTMEQRRLLSYRAVRRASFQTILFSLTLYSGTAPGISTATRGLVEKVVAIIGGGSKFMASCVVFIVSATIPQWVSQRRFGVCSNFDETGFFIYVVLMPFYCGSNGTSIAVSTTIGAASGFVLVWFVFIVET
jgi:hypothetical protein